MGKIGFGFLLGFLGCVWAYELNAWEAFAVFGAKAARVGESYAQEQAMANLTPDETLEHDHAYWLSRADGAFGM
ncbi:MAG: hypothetical protein WD034_10340 [Parvibaculum sp.]|uniref:hypothetical protein n=1 Tax=Parvibaculum sp. TaxID=2024848 RepID=UPI0034A07503